MNMPMILNYLSLCLSLEEETRRKLKTWIGDLEVHVMACFARRLINERVLFAEDERARSLAASLICEALASEPAKIEALFTELRRHEGEGTETAKALSGFLEPAYLKY